MEKLTINIPDKKSNLVKQILKGLGVIIQTESVKSASHYKDKLSKVSTWSENDLSVFEDSKNAFSGFKEEKW